MDILKLIFSQIPMNKYTYIIIALAIAIIAGTFYYTSPTQQWARQEKSYQDEINSLSGTNQKLLDEVLRKIEEIKTLSGQIQDNYRKVNENIKSQEKYQLCIKTKSVDCISADKTAMLQLILSAHATTEDEKSSQDIKAKLLKPEPAVVNNNKDTWNQTKLDECLAKYKTISNSAANICLEYATYKKIIELYANNPGSALEECKDFRLDPKRIVLHYTATPSTLSAQQILQSHLNRWDLDHYAGYHYVVDAKGQIYSTRPIECNALAEPKANHDAIHVSYIGDDKPTQAQIDSIVWLVKDISNRTGISTKDVTAHADIAAKNHKESMDYMFGGYDNFQKLIRHSQIITRDGKQMDALTYAWQAWGDMDFILTIQKESQFNPQSKGDIDRPNKGDYSLGYCQYNTHYQPEWLAEYNKFTTYQEQLNHCHEKYTYAASLPGGVGSRFHGYNTRMDNKDRFVIQ